MTAGQTAGAAAPADSRAAAVYTMGIDGTQPLSVQQVAAVIALCDSIEENKKHGQVVLQVSGTPGRDWPDGLSVTLVSKWERALRRLERLAALTIAVAAGDCGGMALDVLLATDYRIASASVRLLLPVTAGATWPGMALHRLVQQAGAAAVRRTTLFGLPIEAGAALAMRLVDEVTDDTESALAVVSAMTEALPGAELAIRRQLTFDAITASYEDALGVHLAACDRTLRRLSAGAS